MVDFSTSVLREKFTVRNEGNDDQIVVGSNRMVVPFIDDSGKIMETFVIRGKFVHEVARMGAFLMNEFQQNGPILNRANSFKWQQVYDKAQRDYDRLYAQGNWLCVYADGKLQFAAGKHHPFLDIIEKCDIKNTDEYDFSVALAEETFRDAGKNVTIDHLSTIAMVAHAAAEKVRSGVIYRNISKTKTFNFTALEKTPKDKVKISYAIQTSANFLEGLHLAFHIGNLNALKQKGLIPEGDGTDIQLNEANRTIQAIQQEISVFNNSYDVRYRPEMPDFDTAIKDVEKIKAA